MRGFETGVDSGVDVVIVLVSLPISSAVVGNIPLDLEGSGWKDPRGAPDRGSKFTKSPLHSSPIASEIASASIGSSKDHRRLLEQVVTLENRILGADQDVGGELFELLALVLKKVHGLAKLLIRFILKLGESIGRFKT